MSRIALLMSAIALGAVIVLAVSYAGGSEAARPTQDVREQNVDGNGYIAVHEQGVADVNVVSMPSVSGGGCYTNWNEATCAAGYTAVSVGEWTGLLVWERPGSGAFSTGGVICAAPKEAVDTNTIFRSVAVNYYGHNVNHEPCAICCK